MKRGKEKEKQNMACTFDSYLRDPTQLRAGNYPW
jgi:hypothetical protein